MAFNYNGTSPTAIKYGTTDLTVLKYGDTAVWGKPYTLTISAGSNTTITVNRTSSPNQHASTGALSSGSVIYYGDTLTISYSVSSGYNINTHTINGTTFTSGTSHTVTGAVTVVTSAVASTSWHTIYTGSLNVATGTRPSASGIITHNVSVSGLRANVPTRITYSNPIITASVKSFNTWRDTNTTLNKSETVQTSLGFTRNTSTSGFSGSTLYFDSQNSTYISSSEFSNHAGISVDTPTSSNSLPIQEKNIQRTVNSIFWVSSFTITKIEQYY